MRLSHGKHVFRVIFKTNELYALRSRYAGNLRLTYLNQCFRIPCFMVFYVSSKEGIKYDRYGGNHKQKCYNNKPSHAFELV